MGQVLSSKNLLVQDHACSKSHMMLKFDLYACALCVGYKCVWVMSAQSTRHTGIHQQRDRGQGHCRMHTDSDALYLSHSLSLVVSLHVNAPFH